MMKSKETKELRAKARWSILRHALLAGTTTPSVAVDPNGESNNHNDEHDGAAHAVHQQQQQQHSMNTFPGFRVLQRTILPPPSTYPPSNAIAASTTSSSSYIMVLAVINNDNIGTSVNDNDSDCCWDTVLYTYTSSSSPSTLFHKEIQFITRETKKELLPPMKSTTATTTIRDRLEGLLSHRIHNGVDNTGNVRVWDAEMTLAGFLLDVMMMMMMMRVVGISNIDDAASGGCVHDDTIGLMQLKNQIRSMMLSTCTPVIEDSARTASATQTKSNPSTEETTTTTTTTTCNILELGAGQAGLAGLAMMVASSNKLVVNSEDTNTVLPKMKPCRVILTDGHPKCVENNKVCVDLTTKMMLSKRNERTSEETVTMTTTTTTTTTTQSATTNSGRSAMVKCNLLLWDSSPNGAMACRQINNLVQTDNHPAPLQGGNLSRDEIAGGSDILEQAVSADDEGKYHLCLASDCVHFQEFHDGLLTTIARTLAVDGIALLCQPKRGSSLNNFIALVNAVNNGVRTSSDEVAILVNKHPLFEVMLYEEFHPKVTELHKALVAERNNNAGDDWLPSSSNSIEKNSIQRWAKYYGPNWHLPLLLVLRKLRRYDEAVDGELARRYVKNRVK
ncbi:hypothetical protein ACHAWU_003797 [Discostella pseudostelligera]|uniref:Calmodulin-lysine N-methyltransferase n=1 Tax=Discostella pseudostelligera TaxID=259834 RepID=A0ABD3MMQ9_9STRA